MISEDLKREYEDIYLHAFDTCGMRMRPVNMQKKVKRLNSVLGRIMAAKDVNQLRDLYPLLVKLYCELKVTSKSEKREFAKKLNQAAIMLADRDLEFLEDEFGDNFNLQAFNFYLMRKDNVAIPTKGNSIFDKYRSFQEKDLTAKIMDMVQTDPTAEFPKTREMRRHFYLHLGPTNSGKTYEAIQRLKLAECGCYLSPLRLLALEVYDTLNDAGIPTSLLTGEEHAYVENSRVVSQTVETLDLEQDYDVAVIDECQMIADPERGHAWSTAIHGVKAKEVYLLASENVAPLLGAIIEACGDTYEIHTHERKTKLKVENKAFPIESVQDIRDNIKDGDCFILFSKRKVLDMAAHLEMAGIQASVIYGKLPPETRKAEVRRFTQGETKVVVSTDAIGMGVNLPIRRVIFAEGRKFDGHDTRDLRASEILQIAGRAGRFGKYDTGFVTATDEEFLNTLHGTIGLPLPEVTEAVLGFPRVLTRMDADLYDIMQTWHSIPARSPYVKASVEREMALYKTLKEASDNFDRVYGGEDKGVIYDMISCPIDDRDEYVVDMWVYYCMTYAADIMLEKPHKPDIVNRLEKLEVYYKLLELYHMFSLHMGKVMDEPWLMKEKQTTEYEIEEYLITHKKNLTAKCKVCGHPLPLSSRFGICDDCFRRGRARGGYRRR